MQKLIFSLALVVIGVVVLGGVRRADFVWNDQQTVVDKVTAEPAPLLERLRKNWKIGQGETFEPVTASVWAITQAVSKSATVEPRTFHMLSLVVHLINAVLAFLILSIVLQGNGAAFMGGLVFALHPVQVEPVAYVSAFAFVLGSFFALLATWQYLVYAQTREVRVKSRPVRHYYVATLSFILALLTCPVTVVTPLVAYLFERLLPKKTSLIATRTPAWPLALWSFLAVPQVLLTIGAQSTDALSAQLPFWIKPIVAVDAVSFYLSKVFVPVLIGPDYGRSPSYLISRWWGFVTWVLPGSLLLLLVYWRSKARHWYMAATMLLIVGLLPTLGLVFFDAQTTSTVANRYAYLAMLGPALAAAYSVSMPKKQWLPVAVVAAIAAFAYLSRVHVNHWTNDAVLWNHAVQVNPSSPVAHETLGNAFRKSGDWEKSRFHYEKVLESNALSPDIHFYLGEIERQHGVAKKAVEFYKRTLELDPGYAPVYGRLGLAYLEEGQHDLALEHFRKAVELSPESEEPLRNLGMLYARKGEYADAVPYLNKALRLGEGETPEVRAKTNALLGLALVKTKQPEVGQTHLETALALDPHLSVAHRTLADIYFNKGEFDKARPHYEAALETITNDFEIYDNLGQVVMQHKDLGKAVIYFNKALELKANAPLTLSNVGIAYFRLRQFREATDAFGKALALKDLADPHYYLGDMARWQNKEAEALSEYYRALKIDPQHVDANYRLGNHFMKEEKPTQAIRHYQAALKTAPEDQRLIYSIKKAENAQKGG